MFTGIVETTAKVISITENNGVKWMLLEPCEKLSQPLKIGDSVAVNGVCLTVIKFDDNQFMVDVIPETLNLTNLSQVTVDNRVNIETSLSLQKPLGGHIVQGHIDTMAEIIAIDDDGDSKRIRFKIAAEFLRYIVYKGFISIDGMSLTITEVDETTFSIALIPHTFKVTVAANYQVGTKVNIEVDIMAKYIEKQMEHYKCQTTNA